MDRIVEGLKKAIRFEGDGHNFYMMAAGNTSDPKGKEVFEMLAREELAHVRFLRTQYDSIIKSGAPDKSVKLPKHQSLQGDHPIFSDRLKGRIKDAHMEMSALAIGITLELSSIQFYKGEADASDDPAVKEFYTELADWEKEHYDALLRQQDSLKEDYWSAGGFSPF